MSCKLSLNNSIKSNCDSINWNKTPNNTDGNVKFAGEEAKDRLYEPKHEKKLVRVLTVVAYIFFVSLAAIMLSLYYVFIWNGHLKENTGVKTVVIPYRSGCDDDSPQTSMEQTTIDYEDATVFSTHVNFTQQPDVEEFNEFASNFEQLEKKSVFIKKLIRHHNMIPK